MKKFIEFEDGSIAIGEGQHEVSLVDMSTGKKKRIKIVREITGEAAEVEINKGSKERKKGKVLAEIMKNQRSKNR